MDEWRYLATMSSNQTGGEGCSFAEIATHHQQSSVSVISLHHRSIIIGSGYLHPRLQYIADFIISAAAA